MFKLTEYFDPYYNPYWTILQQVGVEGAISKLDRRFDGEWNNSGDTPWSYPVLHDMKRRYERHGFELLGIEDYPPMDKLRMGLDGREQELEWVLGMIEDMGRLEIPMLCYNWMGAINWVRTDVDRPGRAGALVTAFRHADMADVPTWAGEVPVEQMWAAWEWFMDRAVPVAEKAGVRLALHPDDPPIGEVRGVARIFNSIANYERAMDYIESEANAICLCQGNFALFHDDIAGAIRLFGAKGRLAFGHFRDVDGTAMDFVETFHDEGKTDKVAAMQAWVDIGFDGPIRPDHVPTLHGESNDDPAYAWLGRIHAAGYLQGLRAAAVAHRADPSGT